jgi:hypothetical protein
VNAQQYTEIFSDDFNRDDSAEVGNGWETTGIGWSIADNAAKSVSSNWGNAALLRPVSTNLQSGKGIIEFDCNGSFVAFGIMARVLPTENNKSTRYAAWTVG